MVCSSVFKTQDIFKCNNNLGVFLSQYKSIKFHLVSQTPFFWNLGVILHSMEYVATKKERVTSYFWKVLEGFGRF